jgi:hypothetical protein
MRLEDIRVENVRLHGEGQNELIRLKPVVNQYMKYRRVPGRIDGVTFRNIEVVNPPANQPLFYAKGYDADKDVKNVLVEGIRVHGASIRGVQYNQTDRFASIDVRDARIVRSDVVAPLFPVTKP